MRAQGPPTSFPSGLQPVASDDMANNRQIHRRVSRTDLDFEQALRQEGTVVLREGVDVNTLGVDMSPSPMNRSFGSSLTTTPVARTISRIALQPSTPMVVPPTPSPAPGVASGSTTTAMTRLTANAVSSASASAGHSPSSSNHDFFNDPEDAERQTNRRSMYRSPGTSSSPDLATLLRKAKERGGAVVGGGGGQHRKEKRREEPPPPLPDVGTRQGTGGTSYSSATLVASPSSFSSRNGNGNGNGNGDSPEWVLASSPKYLKDRDNATIKAPKSSVRAKTSAFFGKMMGQSTVRERSKTDASLHPATTSQSSHAPPPSLMNAFTPPVPQIPVEHRSPVASPIADVFSTTIKARPDGRKPLPPIVPGPNSPVREREPEEVHDRSVERSIVFVEKMSALPPIPNSPGSPATPVLLTNAMKRRSMSVSDADLQLVMSPVSIPSAPQTPDHRRKENGQRPVSSVPHTPDLRQSEIAPQWEDSSLHGILDVFKGELFTLDPISGSSLDLRDPSTPARQLSYRAKADGLVLSPRDADGERVENKQPSSSPSPRIPSSVDSVPSSRRPSVQDDDPSAPSAIIPPRTSSLKSPARYSLGSAGHATSSRQQQQPNATPSRSRSGPPTTALAAQSQTSPRDSSSNSSSSGNRLRIVHRSTASSSEPSLVPSAAKDDARVCEPLDIPSIQVGSMLNARMGLVSSPRSTSSPNDLASPDSTSTPFSGASTPIITGEEPVDMETRGKELATRCWNENEEFLAKEKIAEWLGGHGQINSVALRYYIDFFDFAGLRLDLAFRRLCAKLFLKGETQQVDRILEQFSRRYWDCNPGGLYGSANIVHAVSYSLLLLNTDLHVAELSSSARMSRNQFVRNTLTAIQTQLQPTSPADLSSSDLTYDDCGSSVRRAGSDETEVVTRTKRSDSITSWNSLSREAIMTLPSPPATQSSTLHTHLPNGSAQSVQISNGQDPNHPQIGGRAWENDMESLLKPLNSSVTRSSISLSPGGGGMMRNRSLRSQPDRLTTLKRGSIRGLQSILSVQSGISPYSSNSSIDGRVSPSPSFATSTHEAMYGSSSSFLNPTLGFASNLSHTIIREAQEDDDRSIHSEGSNSTDISISDEELALLGAPWAKEGMLCRKQYWESAGKRARDKAWLDVFVVIQKGELNMFTFGDTTSGGSGTFGGGNWLANAHPVGTIHLSHSLAHALPPPGYSKRPHCMVLTLANRGVYFFQAGTEELVNEWVSTCNYWAARTSKEPLAGGVSNMEYGWSRVADLYGHGRSQSQSEFSREGDYADSVSVRSGKSTRSKYGWRDGSATIRGPYSPRADKTFINDWKPPLPPTISSIHDEESQLDALRKHVASLKKDLEVHNELREPMSSLYQPRTANAMKSQSNWEEKSQYLLREIVKYELYIDSLQAAMSLRLKRRGEKALERALINSHPADDPVANGKKWKGPEEDPIYEEPEPITPGARQFQLHRRETAEIDDVRR
ncbi:hypothetical protein B0H34DRAFT_673104 [Crassisporium funariophilum]|nr:hypothetical protein B0H34DRAFT_673104 [Crassisporium funariophilum]